MDIRRFSGSDDLKDAFYVREVVFVGEQGVSKEAEFDEFDATTEHVVAYMDGKPVGAARLRVLGDIVKFERICVILEYRKYGIGKALIDALGEMAREKGFKRAKIHGQTQARGFYERLGFKVASEEVFYEEGIPHILMFKDI